MKTLADGTQVSAQTYYKLLDWKDSHFNEFVEMTGKNAVCKLSSKEFNDICKYADIK